MGLLLDTNAVIWLTIDTKNTPKSFRKVIEKHLHSGIYFSAINQIEIAMKQVKGKLSFGRTCNDLYYDLLDFDFKFLSMTPTTPSYLYKLPLTHEDPFDRLLICQALENDLTIVTSDKIFKQYDVDVIEL